MPVLPSIPSEDVKQFYLPGTALQEDGNPMPIDQQAWVKMDVRPRNMMDSLVVDIGDNGSTAAARILAARIKEWNLTETDGNIVPINYATVLRLGQLPLAEQNLEYLVTQISQVTIPALSIAEKKT